jgi:hypothetical protein
MEIAVKMAKMSSEGRGRRRRRLQRTTRKLSINDKGIKVLVVENLRDSPRHRNHPHRILLATTKVVVVKQATDAVTIVV